MNSAQARPLYLPPWWKIIPLRRMADNEVIIDGRGTVAFDFKKKVITARTGDEVRQLAIFERKGRGPSIAWFGGVIRGAGFEVVLRQHLFSANDDIAVSWAASGLTASFERLIFLRAFEFWPGLKLGRDDWDAELLHLSYEKEYEDLALVLAALILPKLIAAASPGG